MARIDRITDFKWQRITLLYEQQNTQEASLVAYIQGDELDEHGAMVRNLTERVEIPPARKNAVEELINNLVLAAKRQRKIE